MNFFSEMYDLFFISFPSIKLLRYRLLLLLLSLLLLLGIIPSLFSRLSRHSDYPRFHKSSISVSLFPFYPGLTFIPFLFQLRFQSMEIQVKPLNCFDFYLIIEIKTKRKVIYFSLNDFVLSLTRWLRFISINENSNLKAA